MTVIFGDDGYFPVGFELPVVLKVKTRLPCLGSSSGRQFTTPALSSCAETMP